VARERASIAVMQSGSAESIGSVGRCVRVFYMQAIELSVGRSCRLGEWSGSRTIRNDSAIG
jgi:hypothetical protein